jgi:hypothetical protein
MLLMLCQPGMASSLTASPDPEIIAAFGQPAWTAPRTMICRGNGRVQAVFHDW